METAVVPILVRTVALTRTFCPAGGGIGHTFAREDSTTSWPVCQYTRAGDYPYLAAPHI